MNNFTAPIVFFDLETTGLDTNKDRIVSISASKISPNGQREIKTHMINPEIPIPKEATAIHGITDEMVKDKPKFKNISKSLLEFIKECIIAGYNILGYDIMILFNEFQRAGVDWDYQAHIFLDAASIFKRKEERTLSAAYKFYLGKTLSEAHNSLNDVNATVEVLFEQLKKYPDLAEMNLADLANYCSYERKMVDIDGKFALNKDNHLEFCFGKYKGKEIDYKNKDHKSFLNWMEGADFSPNTKKHVKLILKDFK